MNPTDPGVVDVTLAGMTFKIGVRHLPRFTVEGQPPGPERFAMNVWGPCVTSGEFVLDGGDWWLVERDAQGPVKGATRAVLDQLWLALREEEEDG